MIDNKSKSVPSVSVRYASSGSSTIADLYDPDAMPADLRAAHERNDEVLERIHIGRRFKNDTERLEKLFELYTKMVSNGGAAGRGGSRKIKGTIQ